MSNPLMKNNPSVGSWLDGNCCDSRQSSFTVSNDLKQLYALYCSSKNPDAFMQQVMSSNPMLSMMQNKGGMKDQFYAECQRRGVDPDAFLAEVERGLKSK